MNIWKNKSKNRMVCASCIAAMLFMNSTVESRASDLKYDPDQSEIQTINKDTYNTADEEKGYNLSIEPEVREDAIQECKNAMEQISDIYQKAEKGDASNSVVSEDIMEEMKSILNKNQTPVITSAPYSVMTNYDKMESFLTNAEKGIAEEIVLYRINTNGGLERLKYSYDGENMYLLAVKSIWNEGHSAITSVSYTRIDEWEYTEGGCFCYQLCVPQAPEVSEIINGSSVIRIRPLSEECRKMSENYVYCLGYQGNNLLRLNWDADNMEKLDYNGLYEYFYQMKYNKKYIMEKNSDGIPAEDLERLMMEFLPVTADQLRKWASFDLEKQVYLWRNIAGGMDYVPSHFEKSLPEVIDIKENRDGTIILTVNAVCDLVTCSDAVITSELTLKLDEDENSGYSRKFKYMGNKVVGNIGSEVPEYQYRIK